MRRLLFRRCPRKQAPDFVGLALILGPNTMCPEAMPAEFGVHNYKGIRFMAKGNVGDGKLNFVIPHFQDGKENFNCAPIGSSDTQMPSSLSGWVDYSYDFSAQLTPDWTEITIHFRKDLSVAKPLDLETVLTHAKMFQFQFGTSSAQPIDLWIDNVVLYR
ncbi:MAG: hypothetical protein JXR76_12965 [Deltaproteobacteria bacterium]|nr:hypothetical protein [Deltaproteobacteria bacterium]